MKIFFRSGPFSMGWSDKGKQKLFYSVPYPFFNFSSCLRFELPHGKTNKVACALSEDSDQPGHPPSLISLRCPHEESLGP